MKKLLTVLVCLSLTYLLLCTAVFPVLACKGLYPLLADTSSNPLKLSQQEIQQNYHTLIDYLLSAKETRLELTGLGMSAHGREHFADVRLIFQRMLQLILPALLITLLGAYGLIRAHHLTFLRASSHLMQLAPLAIGAFMLIDFQKAFILFHKLLFRNDYWLFDPAKDPVILYLPAEFFMKMGLIILLLYFLLSLLPLLLYFVLKKKRSGDRS